MILRVVALVIALLFVCPLQSMAQHPFGPPPDKAESPTTTQAPREQSWTQRVMTQVQDWQQQLYRSLATGLRELREQGSLTALASLLGLSFLYGVLHAAGPGHGKVVLSAYLAADDSAFKRGIVLAFLSSMAQAATAIVVVGVLAIIVGLLSRDVMGMAYTLERISYLMIAGLGAYLIWRAVRGWLGISNHHHHHSEHGHGHEHAHHAHADHIALPTARPLLGDLRETAGVIFSIGIRPCQGAILVLLFALASGIFWAGVLATLVMAIGTALTVGIIAVLSIVARKTATALVSYRPAWLTTSARLIAIAAGLLLIWVGLNLAVLPPPPLVPGFG